VLRSLPGLERAVFARYGSVHRNTYVEAPRWLDPTLEVRGRPGLRIAGQLAGVEGYVESAALGGLAGLFAASAARGRAPRLPPAGSAHAALLRHLGQADARGFQPMNVNWGLFPPLQDSPSRRTERNERLAGRALAEVDAWTARLASDAA
jgi:methylenetetrahydrofolate--tRNA-(uracil-5-)-methyltransferase